MNDHRAELEVVHARITGIEEAVAFSQHAQDALAKDVGELSRQVRAMLQRLERLEAAWRALPRSDGPPTPDA